MCVVVVIASSFFPSSVMAQILSETGATPPSRSSNSGVVLPSASSALGEDDREDESEPESERERELEESLAGADGVERVRNLGGGEGCRVAVKGGEGDSAARRERRSMPAALFCESTIQGRGICQ